MAAKKLVQRFGLVLVTLVVGCSHPTGVSRDYFPIRGKIILDLRETIPPPNQSGTPQPTVVMRTTGYYPCANYQIGTVLRRRGTDLTIEILGAFLPGPVCFDAFGPASEQIAVPWLGACSRIIVTYQRQTDQYGLAVADSTFRIAGNEGSFSLLGDTLVWRFPARSMAYYCRTSANDLHLCEEFQDSMSAHIDLEPIMIPPAGYWPYPKECLVFRYADEQSFQTVRALLVSYTRSVLHDHRDAYLSIQNWRNEGYASWMIEDSTRSKSSSP